MLTWTEASRQETLQTLACIRDWIRAIASAMDHHDVGFGQGTTEAWDDARWLVLGGLGLPPDLPEPVESATLLTFERARLFDLAIRRIAQREPTAYVLGQAWLMGYRFRSDPRAIIPRSHLAELILNQTVPGSNEEPRAILDLCTGSGCLAILAAVSWPHARVWASDISELALGLAEENVSDYGLSSRIALLEGDLFEALSGQLTPEGGFDLIICNPPYVPTQKVQNAPAEYALEPRIALESGPDGMDFIRRLMQQVDAWLAPGGRLVVEVGHEQAACSDALKSLGITPEPIWLDTAGASGHVFYWEAHT